MIYFSEIVGKKIVTEDDIKIGKLDDLVFLSTDKPLITKLYIKNSSPHNSHCMVPIEYLKRIGKEIVIQKNYEVSELAENELYINKNLVDQQIIDITGNKVVRVNDIAIQVSPSYYIAGVDVGVIGVLRWLRLDTIVEKISHITGIQIKSHYLSWADIQPLELARGKVVLKKERDNLEKLHPEDLADHLEKTNVQNVSRVLSLLDSEFAAHVIRDLNITYQQGLFKHFPVEKAVEIISVIELDEAVDILLTLPPSKREEIVEKLPERKQKDIHRLFRLSSTPIGELMTTEFLTVSPSDTAKEVFKKIRKETSDFPLLSIVYVTNNAGQLIGLFNLHELILQDPETQVYKFMIQNVVVVHIKTPKKIAFNKMVKYRHSQLPVIDDEKHILGDITLDDTAKSLFENEEK